MANYRIVTDATADLPAALAQELNVTVIPMEVHLDETEYLYEPTWASLRPDYFYAQVRDGKSPTTTQINVFAYHSVFDPIIAQGEDILYIAFSSALTGSQQSARIAANELMEQYPQRKIIIVDSLSASLGEGLLVYHAAKHWQAGMSLEALTAWVEENRHHLCHWFTVDDLHHLKKGGRVSAAAAAFGTALKIKPVLHVDDEGRLTPVSKVQGRRRSLKALVEQMEVTFLSEQNDVIFIGHGDSLEDAQYVQKLVQERFGITNFVIDYIGPVIGAHSGPGTIALFFLGTKK